jgi:hypothetical protein
MIRHHHRLRRATNLRRSLGRLALKEYHLVLSSIVRGSPGFDTAVISV